MSGDEIELRIRNCANALGTLVSDEKADTGPIGFLCGATYALLKSHELGFVNGEVNDASYRREVCDVARTLSSSGPLAEVVGERGGATAPGAWLAGFYFDSALHRIAAIAERFGVTTTGVSALDTAMPMGLVKKDVNAQKHDRGGILEKGRFAISIEDALKALEELVEHAEAQGLVVRSIGASGG